MAGRCLRCDGPLPARNPLRGFCSREHAQEAREQEDSLVKAGPGCSHCYRGAVFFTWRVEGGRQRVPAIHLTHRHAAPCWCPTGEAILLPGGYKTWGYMVDFDLEGRRELAPRRSVLERRGSQKEPQGR